MTNKENIRDNRGFTEFSQSWLDSIESEMTMSIPHGAPTSQTTFSVKQAKWDIFAFARHATEVAGQIYLAQLPRLRAEVASEATPEQIAQGETFTFSLTGSQRVTHEDHEGKAYTKQRLYLYVQITGGIWLNCQRCLQPYWQNLQVNNTLEIMRNDAEADAAPLDDDEADVIVGSHEFDWLQLLEDELLLSLPLVPKHDQCPDNPIVQRIASLAAEENKAESQATALSAPETKSGKPSPFAVLASLKKDKKTN